MSLMMQLERCPSHPLHLCPSHPPCPRVQGIASSLSPAPRTSSASVLAIEPSCPLLFVEAQQTHQVAPASSPVACAVIAYSNQAASPQHTPCTTMYRVSPLKR